LFPVQFNAKTQRRKGLIRRRLQENEPLFVTGCEGNPIWKFFASLRLGVFALKVFCIFPPTAPAPAARTRGELTNES
jgi:hypothetical protein